MFWGCHCCPPAQARGWERRWHRCAPKAPSACRNLQIHSSFFSPPFLTPTLALTLCMCAHTAIDPGPNSTTGLLDFTSCSTKLCSPALVGIFSNICFPKLLSLPPLFPLFIAFFWSFNGDNSAALVVAEQIELNYKKKCNTFQLVLSGFRQRSVRQSYSCQKQTLG